VTSRAVVGSSRYSPGSDRQPNAIAISTRRRIPPEISWGYSSSTRRGSRIATSGKQFSLPLQRAAFRQGKVVPQQDRDLRADTLHRIGARSSVLWNQRDAAAEQAARSGSGMQRDRVPRIEWCRQR